MELYNVYDDDEYGTDYKSIRGIFKSLQCRLCWNKAFGNFASLQPGEERIVTVAYLGLTKYQSKGYSSSEGVLFTDTPNIRKCVY